MESLSRPLHRRKLSNVNSFSGKNSYDGVFSGHRPKYDRPPAVKVEEYREIFCSNQAGSSIPVLDLSALEESSDGLESTKPDYGMIFGGFRDQDIAISYEELVARDKACRVPSSMSPSSQDLDDPSHQSFDALKQVSMSYNKISQRNKDGLDVTTHVTQLHDVPGFTCFIDESDSQQNNKTMKQKSPSTNNINVKSSNQNVLENQTLQSSVQFDRHQEKNFKTFEDDIKSHPSKVLSSSESPATNNVLVSAPADSQPKKDTEKMNFPEEKISQIAVESQNRYGQDEHFSDDRNVKTFDADLKSYSSNMSSLHAASAINLDKHKDYQKRLNGESFSDERNFETFEADFKSYSSKVSSPAAAATNLDNHKDHQKRSTATNEEAPSTSTNECVAKSDDINLKTFEADFKSFSSKISSPPAASATNLDKNKDYKKRSNAESLSGDSNFKTFEANFKSHSSKVSTSHAASATKLDNHKDHEKRSTATNEEAPSTSTKECEAKSDKTNLKTFEAYFKSYSSKISSPPAASATILDKNKDYQKRSNAESLSGDSNFKTFEADFKSYSSKVSTNLDNHKDHQKRSTTRNEELDVNSAAAALRKAIEKAQESIRIAKESVERKKEGFKGFSSRSFKNSLKVKARVANVVANEEQKEKVDKMKERDHKNVNTVIFPDFADGEKLFGDKKIVNETRGKISELVTNSEIPIRSPFVVNDNKMVCNSKEVVGRIEAESIDSNIVEDTLNDNERPNGFLVLESCEKKLEDTDLTVCQKVETEKKLSQTFIDQDGYVKKFSEESFELLENNMQENLEQENDEEVVKDYGGTGSHSEEEKFYDVSEAESIKYAQTYACKIETNDSSRKEDYENYKAAKSYENSSSDYDDAEENENVIGASNVVDETEEACKIDQNDINTESSQEIDDVSASHLLEVEYKEAVEKEIFENISSDETEDNTDECEAKSANQETCGFADVDFGQNDVRFESSLDAIHGLEVEYKEAVEKEIFENISSDETEDNTDECEAKSANQETCGFADVDFGQNDVRFESSLDAIHGLEIEVKEYQESEETVEEETNLQRPHEETPEIRIEMDTGTPHEPKDECKESEPIEVVDDKEERERERIKLAVERAIREARERAFAEVRQRVLADTREKVTKASIDKTSAQFKLRAERALVERATAEARQRALEKAMKIAEPKTQVNETKQTSSTSQTNTESALRSKAKLEKHNRIMERAANALAEKEKRDLLALREQAERSRLAEYLDADIKRWSAGKEGNLRALLSTLQYILGADNGWQPVSLTEIITTSAVKKAYRKATLCVHPDKVQQRGASIQQKYICEKVFDLLKAAWNRFNSEER